MPRPDNSPHARLERDLAELKLLEIAKRYREVLDDAARKGSSMLEVLATLIGLEQTVRAATGSRTTAPRRAASPAKDPRRVQLHVPQTGSQGGHRAACSTATSSRSIAAPS